MLDPNNPILPDMSVGTSMLLGGSVQREIPAFTQEGQAVIPPDEHVLDHLARAWDLVQISEDSHNEAVRTVAVVHSLDECDVCHVGLARYDTVIRSRSGDSVPAFACIDCTRRSGGHTLGSNGTTYLMLAAEVPRSVRVVVEELRSRHGLSSPWGDDRSAPHWVQTYRAAGFGGPRADGSMVRELLERGIFVRQHSAGALAVDFATRVRDLNWTERDDYVVPEEWGLEDVRHMLWDRLEPRPQQLRDLEVSLVESEARTRRILDSGAYIRSVHQGVEPRFRPLRLWFGESLDRRCSNVASTKSSDPVLLTRIAMDHPDTDIRINAIENEALPASAQLALANDLAGWMSCTLPQRDDVQTETVEAIAARAVSGTFSGPGDLGRIMSVAVHPLCPEGLLPVLVERIRMSGTDARVATAGRARELPADRRHFIYNELLKRARVGAASARLLDMIMGAEPSDSDPPRAAHTEVNADEVDWLLSHSERNIQRLARLRAVELGLVSVDAPSTQSSLDPEHLPARQSNPTSLLGADALAVRLRRLWIGDLGPWLRREGYDLGDCWENTILRRRGLILDLITPIDFGEGDPFHDGLRESIESRIADLTDGHVRMVSWRHLTLKDKPLRPQTSSSADVFHPGDPTDAAALLDTAHELTKRLQRVERRVAAALLGMLSVAGVSQHRLWLAAPNQLVKDKVGTVPYAGGSLFEAVRTTQRRERPLYDLIVDPLLASQSPRLSASAW